MIDLYLGVCSARPPGCIPTPNWPARRSRWPSRPVAAWTRSTVPTGAPTGPQRVIFHTDRGSTYTANSFTELCTVNSGSASRWAGSGSCFDNAAAEAFFSSLEWEVLSRHEFTNTRAARAVVLDWCYGFYNHDRRHSSAGMMKPVSYENCGPRPGSRIGKPSHDSGGTTDQEVATVAVTATSTAAQRPGSGIVEVLDARRGRSPLILRASTHSCRLTPDPASCAHPTLIGEEPEVAGLE